MPGIVNRGIVVPGKPYSDYREVLRYDFWFACAYCSIAESESTGIGFNIDHFHPQSKPFEGLNDYRNLMWSCVPCNRQKGDIWESDDKQKDGYRFLRLDEDDPRDHYEIRGIRLEWKTIPGQYTVQILNLNRKSLRDLRELRVRLARSKERIAFGLQSIRHLNIDRLKPEQRSRFLKTFNSTVAQANRLDKQTESELVVRVLNHSPLIDPDPDKRADAESRKNYLKSVHASIPTKVELDIE